MRGGEGRGLFIALEERIGVLRTALYPSAKRDRLWRCSEIPRGNALSFQYYCSLIDMKFP
jgi:hypothetical protein